MEKIFNNKVTVPAPQPKKSNSLTILLTIFFTLVVILGAQWAWNKYFVKNTIELNSQDICITNKQITENNNINGQVKEDYQFPLEINLDDYLEKLSDLPPQEIKSTIKPKTKSEVIMAIREVQDKFVEPAPLRGEWKDYMSVTYTPQGFAVGIGLKDENWEIAKQFGIIKYDPDQWLDLSNHFLVKDDGSVLFLGSRVETQPKMTFPGDSDADNYKSTGGYGSYWNYGKLANLKLELRLTDPVQGNFVKSKEWADNYCQDKFGDDWFWVYERGNIGIIGSGIFVQSLRSDESWTGHDTLKVECFENVAGQGLASRLEYNENFISGISHNAKGSFTTLNERPCSISKPLLCAHSTNPEFYSPAMAYDYYLNL